MSAAKLISAGLAFSACVLFGYVRVKGSRRRLSELEGLYEDVKAFEQSVRLDRTELDAEVKRLAEEGRCSDAWKRVEVRMSEGLDLASAIDGSGMKKLFSGSEEALDLILRMDPCGDHETVSNTLACAAAKLGSIAEKKRECLLKNERITRSLSIFAGLAAALLII